MVLLLLAGGCAQKGDWIAGTLVTVDVSGTWRGRLEPGPPGGFAADATLTLEQRGQKVAGVLLLQGAQQVSPSSRIEGSVRGDVLSLATLDGRVSAELIVAGDEMSGRGVSMAFTQRVIMLNLKRQP